MAPTRGYRWALWVVLGALAATCAHGPTPPSSPLQTWAGTPPTPVRTPALKPCDNPLPINLPTALQLANVRPIDVEVASQRIQQALGQLAQARVLWLPTVYLGVDYFRHDGQLQDVA